MAGAVAGMTPRQGQGGGSGGGIPPRVRRGRGGIPGLLESPGLLAAGAAGLASAACALWAFRGLPLGVALLWVAPLPLFLAGLGFGAGACVAAALLAVLLVAVAGGGLQALAFLALFALPVPVLAATALHGGGRGGGAAAGVRRLDLSVPLALLGLWPVAVLIGAALFAGGEGGLEAGLRRAVEGTLQRMGVAASDAHALVGLLARMQAAALGFWAGLALLANGAAAQSFLARRGLARAASPDLASLRLPGWYPWLPAAVVALAVAGGGGGDAVPLSALLLLLVPPFYLGVAGVHTRTHGRRGRAAALAAFYVLLVFFLQLMAPAMVALGLFDHFRRRPGGGAAPT